MNAINSSVTGTDSEAAVRALLAFGFASPVQVITLGQFHFCPTSSMAWRTVLPRSRPRTLFLMAM
jgi:hypothetical protein